MKKIISSAWFNMSLYLDKHLKTKIEPNIELYSSQMKWILVQTTKLSIKVCF